MMDLVEQLTVALKKMKAEVIDNQFTLDELCKLIRSSTGCPVDESGRKVIADILSKRHDVRPLDAEGGRWCFGSYTPPTLMEKTLEGVA